MAKEGKTKKIFLSFNPGKKPPQHVNYDLLDAQLRNKLPNEFRNTCLPDCNSYNRSFGDSYCGLYSDEGR